MMRQMRDATKPIMIVVAFAFIGLMVFTWGMDITGQSSGGLGEIGRVNGESVTYDAYMAAYRNLYDQVQRSQEQPVTSQQDKEIEDAAFDEVVNQLLVAQELRRRGIRVTDQEIIQAAQLSPPADLRPQFTSEETGQFDIIAYQTFLASLPPDQLMLLEAYYRDVIPRGKLMRQVSSGIFLSDAELWQLFRDQNEQVEVRFVALDPATRYEDSDFEISDADTEAYFETHQEEFTVPARASVKVVVLGKTPTAADSIAAGETAVAVRQEILDGADFAEVAERESADEGSAALGGDLGVFPKEFMIGPFDSTVFAAPLNTVLEPVRTAFGYHIIEVLERWGVDSAQARHVLIPFERTDDSEIALLMLADSLEDMGEVMPLEEAAAIAGLEITTVDLAENFPFVGGAGQISEGADWAFLEGEPGDVSPVFETEQAFYTLELISTTPEGVLPLEDARAAIESTLRFDRKMDQATLDGQAMLDRIAAGEDFTQVAEDLGLQIQEPTPFTRNQFVPRLGRQNAAIGASFGLRPSQISEVVRTPANAFIIEQVSYAEADSAAWLGQTIQQRRTQATIQQQARLQVWVAALRAAARIVDRRAEVFAPQDESLVQFPTVF
ncbi:MAG: SurA N-terminal domain-containing protein [Gemmatimonadetes bacterium]|nr:SurA N-terminal domain-containing protein [Gemmatimonadota bacterium]